MNRNIRTTYDFAVNGLNWDPSRVFFFGRSIGTGPAVKMASELECGGLILVSPYTSVKDIVSQHAGLVTSWLTAELTNIYPSDETIADVSCPTLIGAPAPREGGRRGREGGCMNGGKWQAGGWREA